MGGETIPDFCGHFRAEDIGQGLPAMDVEVVHYQVNRFRFRVCQRQGGGDLSELKTRTVWRGKSEMAACFGFDGPENIGRPATFIFVIPPCLPSRYGRRGRPHAGMQGDWLFVPTAPRFLLAISPF